MPCLQEQRRGVAGEIGQNAVRARPLECDQAFQHDPVAVEPAIAGRGHQHRIFAGHLIDEGRRAELVLHAAHDVEIGHAGLDHDHVGAFGEIEFGLAQRLVGIAGVHLIGALVALQRARRADRIAERTVKGGGVFRRIGHDQRVLVPAIFQRLPDRADAPVHHVRGREHVASGLGLDQRLADQDFHALVIGDLVADEDAVMAMRGVGIERDVADDADIGHGGLDGADGAADQIVGVDRLGGRVVAQRHVGIGKQRDGRDARLAASSAAATTRSIGQPLHARHRRDRHALVLALDDEERPDEIGGGEVVLADQAPRPFALPWPAQAGRREIRPAASGGLRLRCLAE